MNLTEHEKLTLLVTAENSIASELSLPGEPAGQASAVLYEAANSFVTLYHSDDLRGCIGSLAYPPAKPLIEDVHDNAIAAAFRDPRFEALSAAEWPRCSVSVSVLGKPETLPVESRHELKQKLKPAVDGLILSSENRRAVFLPSVWQMISDTDEFITALARKGSLDLNRPFNAEVFHTLNFSRYDL